MALEKILFVDDEPHLLTAMVRQMGSSFAISTAENGNDALELVRNDGPFAVVISDYRMPDMDGVTLLTKIKEEFPDIIRIILSGNADLDTAIDAVNNGHIFRFLTKPCPRNALKNTLKLAVRQFQLIQNERELLKNTVQGSISMLIELLSLANNRAYSSGYRIKNIVSQIAQALKLEPLWQYEVAALVSQVGCVAVPHDILDAVKNGSELSKRDQEIFNNHPAIGAKLIGRIPRLENVAVIIGRQLDDYQSEIEQPEDQEQPELIRGANLLRAVLDYDRLLSRGIPHSEVIERLYIVRSLYDPEILSHLKALAPGPQSGESIARLHFDELVPGMIAAEDILARNGQVIIAKGQEITWPVLQGLQNFIDHIGIQEPICVWY